jgi:hypothetical protein
MKSPAKFGDRYDEDEVEEELEPGRVPAVDLIGPSTQLRRLEPEPVPVHRR